MSAVPTVASQTEETPFSWPVHLFFFATVMLLAVTIRGYVYAQFDLLQLLPSYFRVFDSVQPCRLGAAPRKLAQPQDRVRGPARAPRTAHRLARFGGDHVHGVVVPDV